VVVRPETLHATLDGIQESTNWPNGAGVQTMARSAHTRNSFIQFDLELRL
jgi:hypothetical protein